MNKYGSPTKESVLCREIITVRPLGNIARGLKGDSPEFPIAKVDDYLYKIKFDALDYAYAEWCFKTQNIDFSPVGCSSVRSGDFYGRNFDWLYGDQVEFIVFTSRFDQKHASIGVAGQLNKLTKDFVETRTYSKVYELLPFMVADGINDAGVVCSLHVVPADNGIADGTIPKADKRHDICSIMLPRFILDRFDTAESAVKYIADYVSVYDLDALTDIGYGVHLMVADKDDTYALEFVDNYAEFTKINDHPYMTNFKLHGVALNADGSVYTPATQTESHNAEDTNKINRYGSGLERYNILNTGWESADSADGMRSLMDALTYSKTYKADTDPFWYTEYVGGGRTVKSPVSAFEDAVNIGIERYENRERGDGLAWQTNHSCVYDIVNRTMRITSQEGSVEFSAAIDLTVEEAEAAKAVAEEAKRIADEAKSTAEEAKNIADEAKGVAETAESNSENAVSTADAAKTTAEEAKENSESAVSASTEAKEISEESRAISEEAKRISDDANEKATEALNKFTSKQITDLLETSDLVFLVE